MKKKILALFVTLLASCSILMFGCNDKSTSEKTTQIYNNMITSFKEDSVFKNSKINLLETNFYLNDFVKMGSYNNKVEDDKNYIVLNAVGLNYIEKYSQVLVKVEKKYNFKNLNKVANNLIKSFENLKLEHDRVLNVEENANYIVYNGIFAKYKYSAKEFTKQVYSVATNLGDFLINNDNVLEEITLNNENLTKEQASFDYNNILVFNDFCNFFMGSCEGQEINNNVYLTAKSQMNSFVLTLTREYKNQGVDEDKYLKYVTISNALAGERKSFETSVQKFSMYEFTTKYESSMEAYLKDDSYADSYYDCINRYLSYLAKYNNYQNNEIVK